VNVTKS